MSNFPPGSSTVLGLPRSHWHCQLENFDWADVRPQSLRRVVEEFLVALEKGEDPHLILTGDPGIGKSHLSTALYRQGVRIWGTELSTWINVPQFCSEVKTSYTWGGKVDPFSDYDLAQRLVVLDDLFGRELTSHETSQIVCRLIDQAHLNHAAVILTMNPPITELASFLRPHEISRVLANSVIVPMNAPKDRRRL